MIQVGKTQIQEAILHCKFYTNAGCVFDIWDYIYTHMHTAWKFNIANPAPENLLSQKKRNLPNIIFEGICSYTKKGGCKIACIQCSQLLESNNN